MNLSILARLGILVGIASISILISSIIGIYGSQNISGLGEDLYEQSFSEITFVSEMSNLYQANKALLARAPSEFDLNQLQADRSQFESSVTEILSQVTSYHSALPSGEGKDQFQMLLGGLNDFSSNAGGVYDAAASFAQEQASTIMNGPIADAVGMIETAFLLITSSAQNSAQVNVTNMQDGASTIFYTTIILGLVLLGSMVAAGWIIGKQGIINPLHNLTDAMNALSKQKLDTEIPESDRKDEIGAMAQALQIFKDNAIRVQKMEEEKAGEEARLEAEKQVQRAQAEKEKQEQEVRAEEEKRRLMNEMADSFEASIGHVVQSVTSSANQMQSSAQMMSGIAVETNEQSTTVASAANQASENVQTVASAAEEMANSIQDISSHVSKSSTIAQDAVIEAEHTQKAMQSLSESAQKIGDVVSLISDIAEQTNLLALNATIEASRAGEAGRGFSVVASEVKSLANQAAEATAEISEQIVGVQNATKDAGGAIEGISKTINSINEIASMIASAVEEQGATTQEIARSAEQAATGTIEVSNSIVKVTDGANETEQSSNQILESSGVLLTNSQNLNEEVSNFLTKIRNP